MGSARSDAGGDIAARCSYLAKQERCFTLDQCTSMNLKTHSPLPQRKDFRIGILGAGFIVNHCHLVAYRKAGFNPVAIASRTRARAETVAQKHGLAKVYHTPERLLDDPSIEVLDIAVPPMCQLGLIQAACQRKTVKGILAQKPLGMKYSEGRHARREPEHALRPVGPRRQNVARNRHSR